MSASEVDFARVPASVRGLCQTLQQAGEQAFVVGGSVRDLLLGRPVSDWDVTTSARPEQVRGLFRKTIPTGIQHGTVTVLLEGEAIEVTTFRGEGAYSDGRRPDRVEFVGELERDLERRDFTVNAIALDPARQRIEDPLDGQRDLERRLIRAVGDPRARFDEDGLRPLRAVRFAAVLGFEIDPPTLAAIPATRERFRMVSAERVRVELLKLLDAPTPSRGVELLRRSELLDEILPELSATIGLTQNRYHVDDVWHHTLKVLDGVPARGMLRLAALLHDVAKPVTAKPRDDNPAENSFHGHERVGAEMCDVIARRLTLSNREREQLCHLVRHHLFALEGERSPSKAALRRFVRRVGAEQIDDLFALRHADVACHRDGEARVEQLEVFRAKVERILAEPPLRSVKDLAIDGNTLKAHLGRAPGRWLGDLLKTMLERVTEDPELNTPEALLALAEELAPEA